MSLFPGRRRLALELALAALGAALLGGTALGIISPRFTPVHLTQQSKTILVGALEAGAGADEWRLAGVEALKGRAPKEPVLRLASFKKEQLEEARRLLAQNSKAPVVFFGEALDKKDSPGCLHVGGQWLRLTCAAESRWDLQEFDPKLSATYAGGTDMLARMVRYILADPNASVPVAVGTSWASAALVGKMPGEVAGLAAVELKAGGPLGLFVASPAGDRLFRTKTDQKDRTAWEDVSAAVKLDSRSRRFAWVDLDRDGCPDLVSWDGKTLGVRLVRSNGTLAPPDPAASLRLDDCLDLAGLAASADGALGILASTGGRPLFLTWAAGKGWRQTELPAAGEAQAPAGEPSACIVADLDNDGFPDVLQPREGGGRLWRGQAGGFATPVKSPVAGLGKSACFALGDFDTDGFLDIFMGGPRHNLLWENDGKAGFREVSNWAGSLSYKAPAGVASAVALDLNHDGRPDLALCYPDAGVIYHFNRGFRCLGEEGDLRLDQLEDGPKPGNFGVRRSAVADFNGDGAEDLAVAFVEGEICCYYNDCSGPAGVRVRLRDGSTGPVTVSAWQGDEQPFCMGTWAVSGSRPARFLSLRAAGKCTVKWSLPGKPVRSKQLEAGDEPPVVVIE
jgi:hypothetical protein